VIEDPPALEENARAAFARFLIGGALGAAGRRRRR